MSLHETMQTKYHLQLWDKKANGPNAMKRNCVYVPGNNILYVWHAKYRLDQSTLSAVPPHSETSKLTDSCWNQLLNVVMRYLLSYDHL